MRTAGKKLLPVSQLTDQCARDDGVDPLVVDGKSSQISMERGLFLGDRVWWKTKDGYFYEGTILEQVRKSRKCPLITYKVIEDKEARKLAHDETDTFSYWKKSPNDLYRSNKSGTEEERMLISVVQNLMAKKRMNKEKRRKVLHKDRLECREKIQSEDFQIGDQIKWSVGKREYFGKVLAVKDINLKVETNKKIVLIRARAVSKCK